MKKTVRNLALMSVLLGALCSTTAYADGSVPNPPSCPPGGSCTSGG